MFLIGCAAFLFFLLGDLNDIRFRRKVLKPLFGIGFAMLLGSTTGLAVQHFASAAVPPAFRILSGVPGLFFLALLVYTLFFALPFKKTYVGTAAAEPTAGNPVCDRGVYALCRHPGILWFFGLYCCLSASFGIPLYISLTYSILNLLYAALQDRYIFPVLLDGYGKYTQTTPFLIPNAQSIRRCLMYFLKTEVKR